MVFKLTDPPRGAGARDRGRAPRSTRWAGRPMKEWVVVPSVAVGPLGGARPGCDPLGERPAIAQARWVNHVPLSPSR